MRTAALSLLAMILLTAAVQAQTFRFSSFEIQGNTRIEEATILQTLGVARGQAISAGALSDGYQRLQASGLFQRVELVPQGSKLLVIVDEFPIINRINIEGNDRLSDDDLFTVIGSTPRRTYSPAQAERDAAAITDAYAQSGRLSATVAPKIIERRGNRVDLVFEVAEGRVSEVERISFVGNRAFSDRRLRRVLETSQAGIFRLLIGSDTFVADRIAFDEQLLRDFYLSRGYADFQVLSSTPELSPSRDSFFITFQIQEGQQFRFGELTASSDLAEIDVDLYQSEIRVRPGDIFSPQAMERTIERLELLATREGLTFIRATPRVTRNDRDLTLDVDFVLEKGERLFVERIDIEGNQTTLDRVIRRQFDTVEGDPFNPREIRAAAERIRALGYFTQADVSAREGASDGTIIVDVDVEEQPTGSLGFGLNYSVEQGPGVAVSFSENNFLGRGQTLDFTIDTGSENTSSSVRFIEPAFLARDLALSFGAFYQETSDDSLTFDTRTIGFDAGIAFPVGEYSRLRLSYGISDDKLTARDPANLSQILRGDEGSNVTSVVGYRWSYNTIGGGLDPTRGVRLSFGQDFAGLGGDTEFVRTSFSAEAQRTVANDEVTLRAAFEGGLVTSLNGTNSLQATRFFNRPSIIRGFETAGIGPRDRVAGDDALGGNRYVAARVEAQFPFGFLPDEYGISGAAFLDVGSVWGLDDTNGGPNGTDPVDDGFFLNSAVGVGILWDTQLGPLRFNFSQAIRKREFDRVQNFDLTIETRF
ncbi:outer membrane protein assembly factor BamA [Jannaschia pagri]|uniref:Outer membrane protein assembly factor BamA n=2 Tax=Jannaschia TaxID=188905 RepID=A0ABQ4NN18_9RHOB|nr:outer membrane protein assembly factor BamA [Jannaschia sp. AI_62]GIT91979.1 outer membrane protein assembly factor BamA [Jannaschia sp. AI_61]GIT95813.1 outer membrane protein assembly factor BamA [Jannaschia sp. AI_62]